MTSLQVSNKHNFVKPKGSVKYSRYLHFKELNDNIR